jgi:ubiquinone/menaquinone biosynthesis C-methylase UbiE
MMPKNNSGQKKISTEKKTSWNRVSDWYDTLLEDDTDTYQAQVIAPNLSRLMQIKKGMTVVDIACGQGYFSRIFHASGAEVFGADIASGLITTAKARSDKMISYSVAPSHKMPMIKDVSADMVTIILAIQNIEKVAETMLEAKRILKPGGKMYIVLNHPAFRIPQASDWIYDETRDIQSRAMDGYMNERKINIDMTPGESRNSKKEFTVSFHRPLQWYMKVFAKEGFVISRLEEWISHKASGSGPRKQAEDKARKEFPMFLCLELQKLGN